MSTLNYIITGTIVILIAFYVFRKPDGTAQIATAIGNVYTGGVKALQGR